MGDIVFVTLLCFQLLRYVLIMLVRLCFMFVVYGVGVCVNVCGVVCVVVYCLCLPSGCCLLYCAVV